MPRHNVTELLVLNGFDEPAPLLAELTRERAAGVVALPADACARLGTALEEGARPFDLYATVDAHAPKDPLLACRSREGEPSTSDGRLLVCPHAESEQRALDERVRAGARLPVEGVLLDRPDAWYAAGPDGAGFCLQCATRFGGVLAASLGEQYVPFEALDALVSPDGGPPPFALEHRRLMMASGEEHGARLVRRVRDEARTQRDREIGVGAVVTGLNPVAVHLATHLDVVLMPATTPTAERAGVGAYEIFRTAAGRRSAVALLPSFVAETPGLVVQAARLASATGVDLALPPDAPDESFAALAAHRRFWRAFRARFRPHDRLSEVLLLYSPACDHFTGGTHARGVLEAAEALTALGVQYRVVLDVPRTGSTPLVLVEAGALPEDDARRVFRRVDAGAAALVVGACGAADDDGRPLAGPFPELRSGLNRVGEGTVFAFEPRAEDEAAPASVRTAAELSSPLEAGITSLLGRGRRALALSGADVVVKTFVDPDRKLDVHLVGRDFDPVTGEARPVSGALLYLTGPAVGGARSGRLFLPDGTDRKVPLIPFGIGVRVSLPDFPGAAVFTVSR